MVLLSRENNSQIRPQICTCHGSPAAETCAKLRPDLIIWHICEIGPMHPPVVDWDVQSREKCRYNMVNVLL